jgi:site-specific DNA-methyltransferase (adenine-specific)
MVIDGTRRLTVLAEFGWKDIPCLVQENLSLAQITHLSYVNNAERKNLSPIDIALHMRTMQERFGYSLRDLETLGYGSPPIISQKIKLLDLPEAIQSDINKGELAMAHGTELVRLENAKQQEAMAKRAVEFGWTAKRTGMAVDKFLNKGNQPAQVRIKIPEQEIPGVYFKDSRDMSELPDKSVHLVVTSPPYHVGMEFEKGISYAEHWDNMQAVMDECARVLVPGGIMAINVGDIHNFKGAKDNNSYTQIQLVGHKYQTFLRRKQIYLTDQIVWVKATHAHSRDISKAWSDKIPHTGYRIIISHDPVYIFRKKGERQYPTEEVTLKSFISKEDWAQWASGIWMIDRVRKMEGHPAIFPDELVRRLVLMFSFEEDVVLDPFIGSGTSIKVARELKRQGIGYERELQYKAVIMEKLGISPVAEAAALSGAMMDFARKSLPAEVFDESDPAESSDSVNEQEAEEAVPAEAPESE